ncbi:peptidoglycan DD-metalloendopeptidase family protein [Ectothiorhodospira mobilis]|uniref:peptidoglycan DD-metalloendopeptidase family protein n=1 Tax=Ectothiorhodospira mobilis TaxID=195064 RepID=UPI001902D5DB|nr:peptidoglycan DD-metalloendopeptidase family protein [Ectothiorhodospira mobilis]MBK1690850.1 peptigoglycan-binding protein LysM [Ectothiorhodospira mobilis]
MRKVLATLVIGIALTGCSLVPYMEDPGFRSGYYTVRRHETLYSIAWRYGLEWRELARWNGIDAPYTIYPGQRLRMNPPAGESPEAPEQKPTAVAADRSRSVSGRGGAHREPSGHETGSTRSPAPRQAPEATQAAPARQQTGIRWQWPTRGEVVRRFPREDTAKRGIGIAGQRGQPVRAAAGGRVVYSGSGLVGYGKLIIVKHDQRYLSAYAHNDKIFVKEGVEVRAGEEIALMGETGTDRPMLHFEIRRDGEPVDPLNYLPDR